MVICLMALSAHTAIQIQRSLCHLHVSDCGTGSQRRGHIGLFPPSSIQSSIRNFKGRRKLGWVLSTGNILVNAVAGIGVVYWRSQPGWLRTGCRGDSKLLAHACQRLKDKAAFVG